LEKECSHTNAQRDERNIFPYVNLLSVVFH
jgi:hypothetical protein